MNLLVQHSQVSSTLESMLLTAGKLSAAASSACLKAGARNQTGLAAVMEAHLDAFQNSTLAESAGGAATGGHQC